MVMHPMESVAPRQSKSASEASDGGSEGGGRGALGPSRKDYAALDKNVQQRLAQNREAARKSQHARNIT